MMNNNLRCFLDRFRQVSTIWGALSHSKSVNRHALEKSSIFSDQVRLSLAVNISQEDTISSQENPTRTTPRHDILSIATMVFPISSISGKLSVKDGRVPLKRPSSPITWWSWVEP